MKITRFVPTLMALATLMTSSVAASTINGVNDYLTPQEAVDLTIFKHTVARLAYDENGAPRAIFAVSVCNSNDSAVVRLAAPYQLACAYVSPVLSHNQQALVTEYQVSPGMDKSVTFRGWPEWIRDGNAPPPAHYDTDSADNRHVRLEFRFGF